MHEAQERTRTLHDAVRSRVSACVPREGIKRFLRLGHEVLSEKSPRSRGIGQRPSPGPTSRPRRCHRKESHKLKREREARLGIITFPGTVVESVQIFERIAGDFRRRKHRLAIIVAAVHEPPGLVVQLRRTFSHRLEVRKVLIPLVYAPFALATETVRTMQRVAATSRRVASDDRPV